MMRKDLANKNRCYAILTIVFILVSIITALKLMYGFKVIEGPNVLLATISVYNVFHPLFVWVIFIALYLIRVKLITDKEQELIEEEGAEAVYEKYHQQQEEFLEAEEAAKEQEDAEKKAKKQAKKENIKEKLHHDKSEG